MANLPQEVQGVLSGNAPGTAGYNPAWFAATDIYWDPAGTAGGSDANSGTVIGSPVLTWAEIIRRYGDTSPIFPYGQSVVTFHQLSSQPAGQDEVYFEPIVSGGGICVLNVALASAGADFACGALSGGFGYAAAAPSAGGVQMTIAAVPAYVVANTLLENTARGSYAFVDALNAGSAVCTQPLTKASVLSTAGTGFPAADNDWVAGDNIKAWTLQSVNLSRWSAKGGDRTAAPQPTGSFVQCARIADVSGAGSSGYLHLCQADRAVLAACRVDGRLQMNSLGGPSNAVSVWGCAVTGIATTVAGNAPFITGGVCRAGVIILANNTTFSNNACLHASSPSASSFVNVGVAGMFCDGTILVQGGIFSATGKVWGSYACTVSPGCAYVNASASTFAASALLTNGALKLGSSATGSAYVGAGVMTDGIAITPAAIDAGGAGGAGLFNPKTGARFCNAA